MIDIPNADIKNENGKFVIYLDEKKAYAEPFDSRTDAAEYLDKLLQVMSGEITSAHHQAPH